MDIVERALLEKAADIVFGKIRETFVVKDAVNYIVTGLEGQYPELAKKYPGVVLLYHNVFHGEDILRDAILFFIFDNKDRLHEISHELVLLSVPCIYHDIGFIRQYDANEIIGADIMEQRLRMVVPSLQDKDIIRAKKIVHSTQVEMFPRFRQLIVADEPLGKYIADADVANFGRTDFNEKADAIYQELIGVGKIPEDTPQNRRKFDEFRYHLITTHEWQTGAARMLLEEQKQKNIAELKKYLHI